MGNSFSSQELKTRLFDDLMIDLAFPFFPAGRKTGSAACCVVDTEWLDRLCSDNDMVSLKSPVASRLVSNNENGTIVTTKQSPTVNVYVNIVSKNKEDNNNDTFMYQPNSTKKNQQHQEEMERWPLITFIKSILDGRVGADQKIEGLNDDFEYYLPMDEALPFEEKQRLFVKRIRNMLWPDCKWFKTMEQQEDDVLLLKRMHQEEQDGDKEQVDISNSNLPNVFAIVETSQNYYLFASYRGATLQDLITYNPGVLSSNLKKGFVIYQLLRVVASFHSRGILHGSLKASNILVDENLWIQLAGMEYQPNYMDFDVKKFIYEQEMTKMNKCIPEEPLVQRWVKGSISNFSYLMALNNLAGRREGDPNFHPILPWVTDFSGESVQDGWRTFTMTKFRINKGDEQLDFTFDDGPVPHHITDILSDITYYVYKARRTPIPVLCQFVRSKYEPNEYPSSMQRLYQWTPDECIPEFYTDPTIFKSIHSDMPDLQIPKWAESPKDFILKHAEALESEYVSANLHHWIDLTFGSNLTGKAAVEAKNVALPLLAGQNSFMKHGIIQLFKNKHPQRGCNWNKTTMEQLNVSPKHMTTDDMSVLSDSTISKHQLQQQQQAKSSSVRTRQTQETTNGLLSSSPLNTSTRDRTPSIHSTASSIDTTSRNSLPSVEPQSTLRTDPIRIPMHYSDSCFIENLDHYEDMIAFAAKYDLINKADITINPIYHPPDCHFNIDPPEFIHKKDHPVSEFEIAAAHDMQCVGHIIRDVYTAGNEKVLDNEVSTSSGYFEMGNGDIAYDIAPTGKIDVPPAVTGAINALLSDNWQERPTSKGILCASSFPLMTDPKASFPFPEAIPEMYEFLAAFHQAEWSRRLYLADKWIDRMCDLEDEVFLLVLPSFSNLFTHVETRVGSISLFPKLAHRLGPDRTRQHLLKRIISMFEALRPNLPRVLFDHHMISEFIKRLGISTFLQQMLPCYLEALTIQSDDNSAGEALIHICHVLGAILTSKHIIRQLVKIMLRENGNESALLKTTVKIASMFGVTFTSVQYAYLISLIGDLKKRKKKSDTKSLVCIMTLLEELMEHMSNENMVTELKSGFIGIIYQLLENNEEEQRIARLTMSIKTIEYLLRLSKFLTLQEWEATVVSTLQKYFSGFSSTFLDDNIKEDKLPTSFEAQKIYQMIYAYSRLSTIVSKEKMRQMIPTSDAIQSMILEYFSSAPNPIIEPTHSVSTQLVPPKKLTPTRSDSTVSNSKFMSWISKQDKQQEIKRKPSVTLKEKDTLQVNVDFVKLYSYATKDLFYMFEKKTVEKETVAVSAVPTAVTAPTTVAAPVVENAKVITDDKASTLTNGSKSSDKDSTSNKSKVPTSVLPWKTRWKPSPEDKKNWNRFLSTNSEEMSKSMQFSFNDLKLRGFAGHNASIRTFAVNEPLKLFASGSRDRTVKIWSLNVHDGIEHWETDPFSESLVTYTGHKRSIHDLHFLSPGLNDVVASCDGHLHIWDPNTGVGLHQFNTGRASIISAKPIFQSRHIVGGTMEGNITFFDAYNYTQIHTWKSSSTLTGVIRVIAVNQAETLVAVGFSTGAISLIESRTGTLVASWKGGDSEITLLKFYTDDILLSCATADHLVCCWNVNRLALVKTISAPQDITSLDIYKDEILTINGNNSVSFIPITDDFQAYSSKFKTSIMKSQVSSFGIIPTDQLILFGCAEGEIFLYA